MDVFQTGLSKGRDKPMKDVQKNNDGCFIKYVTVLLSMFVYSQTEITQTEGFLNLLAFILSFNLLE